MVDEIPTGLLQAGVQVRNPRPVFRHGAEVQRGRVERHRRRRRQPHEQARKVALIGSWGRELLFAKITMSGR